MPKLPILLLCLALGGCAQAAEGQRQRMSNLQVRYQQDAYEAARAGGDLLGMCVKAGLVAAGYEDAGDAANSRAWQARKREDCQLAMTAMGVTPPAAP